MSQHTHLRGGIKRLHSHSWLIGMFGLVAGLAFLVYAPSLKAVSSSLFLFAGFHIVGAIVLLASAYSLGLRKMLARLLPRRDASAQAFDFGWGPAWMNGLAVVALGLGWAAIVVELAAPAWWPLAFALLLLGGNALIGNLIMRSFRTRDYVVLPMVELTSANEPLILDAGCGSGRTTIALGRVLGKGRVVAVDRFDADYIDGGGRSLIARNLAVASLSERVTVETADLTKLPFADATFDAAISTNVFDHLGENKNQALREAFRVMKPGARFLLGVWVPGWTMFAVGNALSFFLTSRAQWRRIAREAGFTVADEGVFNYVWFAVLQKPAA
jgi:SAM-dependent methyltransferase